MCVALVALGCFPSWAGERASTLDVRSGTALGCPALASCAFVVHNMCTFAMTWLCRLVSMRACDFRDLSHVPSV